MGWLGSGLTFRVSCLILVWAAGAGKSPPLARSATCLLTVYLPASWDNQGTKQRSMALTRLHCSEMRQPRASGPNSKDGEKVMEKDNLEPCQEDWESWGGGADDRNFKYVLRDVLMEWQTVEQRPEGSGEPCRYLGEEGFGRP